MKYKYASKKGPATNGNGSRMGYLQSCHERAQILSTHTLTLKFVSGAQLNKMSSAVHRSKNESCALIFPLKLFSATNRIPHEIIVVFSFFKRTVVTSLSNSVRIPFEL